MGRGPGLEPYDAHRLARYLSDVGGERRPSTGGGRQVFDLPGERVVVLPNTGEVPTPVAKRVAESMGKTYAELRADLGHPVVNGGAPKRTTDRSQPSGCSKREVLNAVAQTRVVLTEVEQAVRPGVRDSAFYLRVLEAVSQATHEARRAVEVATRTGAHT